MLGVVLGRTVGEQWQLWVWLVAVLYDFAAVYLGARGGGWVVRSAAHFAERHGLVVILALGESIVAIGAGVAQEPISIEIVAATVLAIGISLALWWLYFRELAQVAEHAVAAREGTDRSRLATALYTYLHFPVIAGIIVTALGIEQATAHLAKDHLGQLGGWSLAIGTACVLLATTVIAHRAAGVWLVVRFAAAGVLLALGALLGMLPPLPALGVVLAVLIATDLVETLRTRAPGLADSDR